MSVFASDVDGGDHVRRSNEVGGGEGGDSDFLVERPNQRPNLIEEEGAEGSERTFSDAGVERSEAGDQEMGEGEPVVGQGEVSQAGPDAESAVQAGFRRAQEQADEAEYQAANLGVPKGFSASRRAPAVPVLKGARSRRIREAADTGVGTEPSASKLKSARKGLLAGMSKDERSAWRRMENQQKLPRRVGFGQESSVPFDWRDKTEQVAADLASDDEVRAQPRSFLEMALPTSRSTNEQARSIAKPSTFERNRGAADARSAAFNARGGDNPVAKQRGLADYLLSLNHREQRDSAYIKDGFYSGDLAFGHSNRGMKGLVKDYDSAEKVVKQGGPGAAKAREQMAIIASSEGDKNTHERQAKALGHGDAGRGMVGYHRGSSQYVGRGGQAQAGAAGQDPTQGAIVQRANASRGIASRMFDTFARWMPGLGRLFGQGRDTRFSAAPGQEANRILAKRAQGEQLSGQRSAPMFSMSRLFGASPRTRPQAAPSPQIEAMNVPDSIAPAVLEQEDIEE